MTQRTLTEESHRSDQMRSALEVAGLNRGSDRISKKTRATAVSQIKEMAILAERVEGAISLGWGLPSFNTSAHIRRATQTFLEHDDAIGKYPHPKGLIQLRQSIAERFKSRWNATIDPETEILVTVGAQQAMSSALQALIDPGDEVILLAPCFSSHMDQVLLAGGIPKYVSLIEGEGWKLNIEDVKDAIGANTKAIILNYPANPTGTILTESELRFISELAIDNNFFIITDETYNFLTYDDQLLFNLFSVPELRNNLIGCYSFSKEYAMTGWRVGYLCAGAGVVDESLKIHDATVITAPRISQVAALAALQGPQDSVAQYKTELAQRRELMSQRLNRLSELFTYSKPAGAYYMFPRLKIPGVDSFELASKILQAARVVTVPGAAFGPGGQGHLRLCFAVTPEEINEAFDRLEQFFQDPDNLIAS